MIFEAGQTLFEITVPGASRAQIAEFSEGTEDPNPIHVDEAFAQAVGFPTVIQQGPMTTAHFARLLSECVGSDRMRWLDVSFTAPVFPDESLVLKAIVSATEGESVTVSLTAEKSDGALVAKAEAGVSA